MMQVIDLAKTSGVTPDTVRFYTREGLLAPSKNPQNGYKIYGDEDLNRLQFITAARTLGFTVEDIRQILGVAESGETPCPLVRELIEVRLVEIDERIRQMVKLRERMRAAVNDWKGKSDREPTGETVCHLIESFKL